MENLTRQSWLVIARNVASLALAAIAIAGLTLGSAALSAYVEVVTLLALSSIWVVLKIAAHFHQKIMVEPHLA